MTARSVELFELPHDYDQWMMFEHDGSVYVIGLVRELVNDDGQLRHVNRVVVNEYSVETMEHLATNSVAYAHEIGSHGSYTFRGYSVDLDQQPDDYFNGQGESLLSRQVKIQTEADVHPHQSTMSEHTRFVFVLSAPRRDRSVTVMEVVCSPTTMTVYHGDLYKVDLLGHGEYGLSIYLLPNVTYATLFTEPWGKFQERQELTFGDKTYSFTEDDTLTVFHVVGAIDDGTDGGKIPLALDRFAYVIHKNRYLADNIINLRIVGDYIVYGDRTADNWINLVASQYNGKNKLVHLDELKYKENNRVFYVHAYDPEHKVFYVNNGSLDSIGLLSVVSRHDGVKTFDDIKIRDSQWCRRLGLVYRSSTNMKKLYQLQYQPPQDGT